MDRVRRAGALLLLLPLLLTAGCRQKPEQTDPVLVIATPAPKEEGKTLNVVIPEKIDSLHPLRTTQRETRSLLGLVYEDLLAYDSEGNLNGCLAASVETDERAKVWTVSLRPQAKWQGNGRGLTAADLLFTLDLMREMDGDCAYSASVAQMESWEKVDDLTVSITFRHGWMGNREALSFPVLPLDAGFGIQACPNPAIGTGPYVMDAPYTEGGDITLSVNPGWWKQPPAIATVTARSYADPDKATDALMLGQVDAVQLEDPVSGEYAYVTDTHSYAYVTDYFEFIAFNMESEQVSDLRLRQAVSLAIDREAVSSNIYRGKTILADSPFWVGCAQFRAKAALAPDTARARALMDEIDPEREKALTLLVYDSAEDPLRSEAAAQYVRQMQACGITVTAVTARGEEFSAKLRDGEYDMLMAGWYLSEIPDLSFCLSSEGEGNVMNYRDETMDACLNALLESGVNGFDAALQAVRVHLAGDLPMISLYYRTHTLLTTDKIRSVGRIEEDNAFGDLENWTFTDR